ncbi:transcriptional regulator, partial [Streptomyces sp. NPDC006386]
RAPAGPPPPPPPAALHTPPPHPAPPRPHPHPPRDRAATAAADDPLERLLQDHGVRGIAWRAAQLPTDQHRDKVAEWLDMLLESVKRPES